ncbi:hypothetical protein K3495_g3938 [Podosphaera aphanis]|nr:hypothetical protein K3495_g3938 [Podosphaera aphanis]
MPTKIPHKSSQEITHSSLFANDSNVPQNPRLSDGSSPVDDNTHPEYMSQDDWDSKNKISEAYAADKDIRKIMRLKEKNERRLPCQLLA